MSVRIIPRLDIKGPNVVKGVHMEGLRILGTAERFATHYYQQGADELIYLDTVASLYGRNNLAEIVSRAAAHIFISRAANVDIIPPLELDPARCESNTQENAYCSRNWLCVKNPRVAASERVSRISATIFRFVQAIKSRL